jgi:hypothetical protein
LQLIETAMAITIVILSGYWLDRGQVTFSLKGVPMKRALGLVAAVLLASGVAFGQAAAPATKPAALPAGVVAVVEFGSIETLQKHVTDFLTATGAVPPGQLPPVVELFSDTFYSTDLTQLDVTQPARFVLVKAGPRKVEVVLQCTVKDLAAYRAALQPSLTKGEEKDGVMSYAEDDKTVAIGESGKVICVGENAAAVAQVLALVKSNALPQTPMLPGGDVVASLGVKSLLNHLADEKGVVLGDLKESMKNMLSMAPGAGQGPQAQAMLEAEVDALENFLKQVDRATISLTPDAQEVKLSAKVEPVQGSLLAVYLATVPVGIPATLKYMPEDAFAVCAFKVGNLEPLAIPFIAFSAKVMAAGGADPAQVAQLSSLCSNWLKAYGDDMTFALRSGQGMRSVMAGALKDPEMYKSLLQKMPELFGALNGFYRNMGVQMQVQSEAVKYNDHDITHLKVSFDAKPAPGATPEQTEMVEQQQKAMHAMFGEGMTQDVVILGKDTVTAQGTDSLDTVKQVMDGKLKKLVDREDFKKTLASIPPESCGFCVVHLTGLAEFAISFARTMLPIPDISFQRGPGATAVFVTAPGGSSVTCNVRVPAAEIKAISDGIKSLSGQPPAAGAEPSTTPVPPAPEK